MASRKHAPRRKVADTRVSPPPRTPVRPKLTPVPPAVRESWGRPMFSLIDMHSMAKQGPNGSNNDRVLELPGRYSVVADGAGPNGGDAAQCVIDVIARQPLDATQRQVADAITAAMQERGWEPKPGERMKASTAAILNYDQAKIWLIGDAKAAIVFEDGVQLYERDADVAWERRMAEVRIQHNRNYLRNRRLPDSALYDFDPGYAMLKAHFDEQHAMANEEGGYSVFCAKPLPDSMLWEVSVPNDARAVVLMSDGYPAHAFTQPDYTSVESMNEALMIQNIFDPHCMGGLLDDGILGGNPGIKGIVRDPYTGELNVSHDDFSCILLRVL